MSLEIVSVSGSNEEDIAAMGMILCDLGTETHALAGQDERNDLVRQHFAGKAEKIAIDIESGKKKYWAAKDSGIIVGMGGYSSGVEQLHSLYVPQKGRGIGSLIFEHIVSQPETVPNYSAWIADINLDSFKFFYGKGLRNTGNTGFWELGDDNRYSIVIHQVTPGGQKPSRPTVD